MEKTKEFLNEINNQDWKEKSIKILEGLEKKHKYSEAPAAKKHHHDYLGGLEVHTCEVIDFALEINKLLPVDKIFDTDLVILAAFLHDLEKPYTYKWSTYLKSRVNRSGKEMDISHINFPCSGEAIIFRLCARVGLVLPMNVISAIEFAHGGWSTQASNRFVEPCGLAMLIHSADLMSSRFGKIHLE